MHMRTYANIMHAGTRTRRHAYDSTDIRIHVCAHLCIHAYTRAGIHAHMPCVVHEPSWWYKKLCFCPPPQ